MVDMPTRSELAGHVSNSVQSSRCALSSMYVFEAQPVQLLEAVLLSDEIDSPAEQVVCSTQESSEWGAGAD